MRGAAPQPRGADAPEKAALPFPSYRIKEGKDFKLESVERPFTGLNVPSERAIKIAGISPVPSGLYGTPKKRAKRFRT